MMKNFPGNFWGTHSQKMLKPPWEDNGAYMGKAFENLLKNFSVCGARAYTKNKGKKSIGRYIPGAGGRGIWAMAMPKRCNKFSSS